MRNYSLSVKLLIALVGVVILGNSLNIIDATFGTHLSSATGIWFAAAAAILLVAYIVVAVKNRKK
ncbi:MAG: hypothetical protein P4N59_20110 [Negativicutes bacterium]|nr:hypothetical protein [Negativicutes bacterium]